MKKPYQCLTDPSTMLNIGLETKRNTHHKILRVSGHQQLNLFAIDAYGTKQQHKPIFFSIFPFIFSVTKKIFFPYKFFHSSRFFCVHFSSMGVRQEQIMAKQMLLQNYKSSFKIHHFSCFISMQHLSKALFTKDIFNTVAWQNAKDDAFDS